MLLPLRFHFYYAARLQQGNATYQEVLNDAVADMLGVE
jgi:hypothetical protein